MTWTSFAPAKQNCMSVETLILFFDTYGNTEVPLVLNLEAKAAKAVKFHEVSAFGRNKEF